MLNKIVDANITRQQNSAAPRKTNAAAVKRISYERREEASGFAVRSVMIAQSVFGATKSGRRIRLR